MSYKIKIIAVGLCIGIANVIPVYAQPTNDAWSQTLAKFKNEQLALARPSGSELVRQQRFVQAAIEVFIQQAQQVQNIVRAQTDIFPSEKTKDLLVQIAGNLSILRSYHDAIAATKDTAQLRALVGEITTHRASIGRDVRRSVLAFYIEHFQKINQREIAARYQAIQEYIHALRAAGKDTTVIEKTFAPAADLMEKITATMAGWLSLLEDSKSPVSLDNVETALQITQKNISAMYDIFRRTTFQEAALNELNKEEQGIQKTFPKGNL